MTTTTKKKLDQLCIHPATAANQLKKIILFDLLKQLNKNQCFQCNKSIDTVNELSIEHKIPYLDSSNPVELFFDLNNIAFSHLICNIGAARQTKIIRHPSSQAYMKGCRCKECKNIENLRRKDQRKRGIKT
ncbi:MAG: hypothetical protein KKF08_19055 [Gammaproteobacteria bacterium]|nr:hypothetical protein [Gammaproteobacteria bacterium]